MRKLIGGKDSGEENKKGKSSGCALENWDEMSMIPWVVGTFQVTRHFAPTLTATINSTRYSVYDGVHDQSPRVQ